MRHFVDDDAAYLQWVADHPGGFVINTGRHPTPTYLKLHRSSCRTIRGLPAGGSTFTGDYTKLCGEREELEAFAHQLGGAAQPCGLCLAQPRPRKPAAGTGTASQPAPAAPTGDDRDGHQRSRWRAALTNPWAIAIGAPLIVAALIAIGAHVAALLRGDGSTLNGSVECVSGRSVVDVWIAASSGQSDSGYAHLGPITGSGLNYPAGPKAAFTYLLRHGGTYSVHVGCGGTAARWASKNFSPVLSGRTVHLECRDPTTRPVSGGVPEGRCTVTRPA